MAPKNFRQTTLRPLKRPRIVEVDVSSSDEALPLSPNNNIQISELSCVQDETTVTNSSDASQRVTSPTSPKTRTSDVHPFFITSTDDGSVSCKLCKEHHVTKKYKSVNTDTMRNHLNKVHPDWKNLSDYPLFPGASVPSLTAPPLSDEQQDNFEQLLIEWLVCDQEPLAIVDSKKFIKLIKFLNESVKIPSRNTIRKKIIQQFEDKRLAIKNFLIVNESRMSLTCDLWTSGAQVPFLGITAHLIDKDFILKSFVLDMKMLPHPHSAVDIADSISETLEQFEISNKVIAVTTDNGKNIINAIKQLSTKDEELEEEDNLPVQELDLITVFDTVPFGRRCLGHILNLAARAGLDLIKPKIKKSEKSSNQVS
ncbi:hypothetical protein RCL1_004159 [Eukaryota sp. TZLM3-RCL]